MNIAIIVFYVVIIGAMMYFMAIKPQKKVIVEFGNNKNCRISMQKKAIAQVEKPSDSTSAE